MKRIKVQTRLSILFVIFISALIVILGIAFGYLIFTDESTSFHTKSEYWGFIGMVAIFIPLWLKNAQSNGEYVSEMILSDKDLTLIYKKKNQIISTETIELNDIESVEATLSANNVRTGKSVSLFCETSVTINRISGRTIYFTENPTASFSFCNYDFMLRLLSISKDLPNFKYKVKGNSNITKADVKYFAIHGKRLSPIKRGWMVFKAFPKSAKIILIVAFIPFLICVSMLIYLNMPPLLNSTDREYVSYIDEGYKYFQDDNYFASLNEYDKALKIHNDDSSLYYYRSLTYYYDKQYEKAMEEAEKGIECLNKKSVYRNGKNWKLIGKDDIELYTQLGDSARRLERYDKAVEAYNYVVNHSNYTYTDVYYDRGRCKYYLGDIDGALKDFQKHQEIIEKYLYDQSITEYKDLYPRYDQKDLNRVRKWIKTCYSDKF